VKRILEDGIFSSFLVYIYDFIELDSSLEDIIVIQSSLRNTKKSCEKKNSFWVLLPA
jgi:hypothetical protein